MHGRIIDADDKPSSLHKDLRTIGKLDYTPICASVAVIRITVMNDGWRNISISLFYRE